jgi:hypothetical protein
MVPFRGFFKEMLVLDHLLFIWEGDAVDSLERVILGVAKPVGRRILDIRTRFRKKREPNLHDGECLDSTRVWDMRTGTQVNEWTTSIDRGTPPIRNLVLDKVDLVLAVLEHLK